MSPPSRHGGVLPTTHDVRIIPTFLSTDLVTPGRHARRTLPAIGVHQRSSKDYKLWGQETKATDKGHLAYNHFKPSHLETDNVVVTHRHFDNRILNVVGKEQPCFLTTLLLSKCRLNDQRMPPPFESEAVETRFIKEPIPEELRNSYFSHRCKFQVFPTAGVDQTSVKDWKKCYHHNNLKRATIHEIDNIKEHLYGTSTYLNEFQIEDKDIQSKICNCPNQPDIKNDRLPTTKNCRLTNAKLGKNQTTKNYRLPNTEMCTCTRTITNKEKRSKSNKGKKSGRRKEKDGFDAKSKEWEEIKCIHDISLGKHCIKCTNLQKKDPSSLDFPVWPSYPPGNNITNNPPNYPRVILPKYCIQIPKENSKSVSRCGCKQYITTSDEDHEVLPNNEKNESSDEENNKPLKDETSEENLSSPSKIEDIPINEDLSRCESTTKIQYKRRFNKTEARRRFQRIHKNIIPDLRDATREGRKHDFFGFNAHVFRG